MRLSPDGAKLAYKAQVNRPSDIWVDELARGVRTPLTNDPGSGYTSPTWSPDGSRILFGGGKDNAGSGIYQMNSNGAGGKELLLGEDTPDLGIFPTSWSPDGRFILYVRAEIPLTPMRQEVWVLPLVGDRKPRLFVQHDGSQAVPEIRRCSRGCVGPNAPMQPGFCSGPPLGQVCFRRWSPRQGSAESGTVSTIPA